MKTNSRRIGTVIIVFGLILSGCGPGQIFGPTRTPTPVPTATATPTPIPDAIVTGESGQPGMVSYYIWEGDLPQERSFGIATWCGGTGGPRCITTGDTYTILGQLSNCEFLKIQTTDGMTGWILGMKELRDVVQFNKTCDEVPPIYLRPLNGTFTSYGQSLLMYKDPYLSGGANVFDLEFYDQDSYFYCNLMPCSFTGIGDMYLGSITIFNYMDTDALVILSPYFESSTYIGSNSQMMYVYAGESISFPICEEEKYLYTTDDWVKEYEEDGSTTSHPGIKCFTYSPAGKYRVFAITGRDYNDADQVFDTSAIYWSTSYIFEISKPVLTRRFTGRYVSVGHGRSPLSSYFNIDYDIVVISPEVTEPYFDGDRTHNLAPISQEQFPSP